MSFSRVEAVPWLERLTDETFLCAVVIGAGGTGKSTCVEALSARVEGEGCPFSLVRGSAFSSSGDEVDPADGQTLLVDDAHLLSDKALDRLVGWAEIASSGTLVVACRPSPPRAQVGRLVEIAERAGALSRFAEFDRHELSESIGSIVGRSVDGAVIEAVEAATLGNPLLVDRLGRGWVKAGHISGGLLSEGEAPLATPELVDALEGRFDQLDDASRTLLAALSYADAPPPSLAEEADVLHAWGLARRDGVLPPVVAAVARQVLPPSLLGAGERMLAKHFAHTGATPTEIADRLWNARAQGAEAEEAYLRAANGLLDTDPQDAAEWYRRADRHTGSSAAGAGRVAALAAAGNTVEAAGLIEDVLRNDPQNAQVLGASAQIAAIQGRWSDAAARLGEIASHPRWSKEYVHLSATLCRLIGGDGRLATDDWESSADAATSTLGRALHALESTVLPVPDVEAIAETVRDLARQADTLPARSDAPIGPAEVGSVAAIVAGEFTIAEVLIDRSRATAGRNALAASLRRWIAVRSGDRLLSGPDAGTVPEQSSPSVALLELATDAAIARRAGDVSVGRDVLDRLRTVVSLAPIDLLGFDAACELLILARRFDALAIAQELEHRAERLLDGLECPPLWEARLRWCQVEAAVATQQRAQVESLGRDLSRVAGDLDVLRPLVRAAELWVDVLEERVDVDLLESIVIELRGAGYIWEASSLVGQAAIRIEDADTAKRLLGYARSIRTDASDPDGSTSTEAGLSEREIEVGRLVIAGHSYKGIGSRLFISPKTVEHHVSHIRQKLDAVGIPRAEFLAALRTDLGG